MTLPASHRRREFVGILLAAGLGARFQAASAPSVTGPHKLLAALPDGALVAQASAASLLQATPRTLAVIAEQPPELAQALFEMGCELAHVPRAPRGMGISLAVAARTLLAGDAPIAGCVVALADMPWVRAETIQRLLAHASDDRIVVPLFEGRRGHPVVFGATYLPELSRLAGDTGAKSIVQRYGAKEVECDDPGVLRDVDTPSDLYL